jgi:hypothetical protein
MKIRCPHLALPFWAQSFFYCQGIRLTINLHVLAGLATQWFGELFFFTRKALGMGIE